jgi:hypothetical protein
MAEHKAFFPSSESVSPHGQAHPPLVTNHGLRAPPEGADRAVAPAAGQTLPGGVRPAEEPAREGVLGANSLAMPGRNSFHPAPFDERWKFSALSTSQAPYEEALVVKDIHQPERDGKNDFPRRSASRHSRYGDQQNPAGQQEVTSQLEQSPLPPVESKDQWNHDPRTEEDANPPSLPGEDQFMPMRRREEKSSDYRVESLRDLSGEIEPLLPLSRLVQDAVQPPASLPGSYDTAGEEKTEIHITIGRVEVTALSPQELEKPTKQVARRRLPMSLDEYLLKRHGRAS